jgi:mycothiol synthase
MTDLDLVWTVPTVADVPAWTELFAAVEAEDRLGEVLAEEDVGSVLELSYFDAPRDGRLLWSPDGELVASGTVVCTPSARQWRIGLSGTVRPSWRGRGIGTALVKWQVERGLEVAAERLREAVLPAWLEVEAPEEDTSRNALFAEHGFSPVRYYLEMRRPLAEPIPDVAVPRGLSLVPFDPARDAAVRDAHNEAFLDHWGSTGLDAETWAMWVSGHHEFRPDLSFIVLDGEEIAGYAMNSVHPKDWPTLGFTEGWTHQLGVRRPWRGRGVARALLHATFTAFVAEGLEFAALDVDAENPTGALALYSGMGYARDRCRVAWGRDV